MYISVYVTSDFIRGYGKNIPHNITVLCFPDISLSRPTVGTNVLIIQIELFIVVCKILVTTNRVVEKSNTVLQK
jgi:hypothetical protein